MSWESNPGSKEHQYSPTSSANYNILNKWCKYSNLWIISTCNSCYFYYFANEWDWTNTIESGCAQKFETWKSLWLRSKNTSWCRIRKWHCLKTRRFKTPTCFLRHPRRIFLENFESHCRVRRSTARRCERRVHRERKLFLRANLL